MKSPVKSPEESVKAAVEIHLVPTGTITGLVLEEDKPIAGVKVQMMVSGPPKKDSPGAASSGYIDIATTDESGRFTFPFVEADREVHLLQIGFGTNDAKLTTLCGTWGSTRGRVAAGQTVELKPIVLMRLDKSVSGVVVDPDGKPVDGASVMARPRSRPGGARGSPKSPPATTGDSPSAIAEPSLAVRAYINPPEEAKDHAMRFSATVDAEPGQTDGADRPGPERGAGGQVGRRSSVRTVDCRIVAFRSAKVAVVGSAQVAIFRSSGRPLLSRRDKATLVSTLVFRHPRGLWFRRSRVEYSAGWLRRSHRSLTVAARFWLSSPGFQPAYRYESPCSDPVQPVRDPRRARARRSGRTRCSSQVKACGICGSDVHGMDGSTGRRVPPIIMGHEAAGVDRSSSGSDVGGWAEGDRVTFDSTIYCGQCCFCRQGRINLCDNRRVLGVSCDEYRQDGAFAEYVAVPRHILYRLPEGLAFRRAAMVEPLSIAVHAVGRMHARAWTTRPSSIGAGMIGLLVIQALRAAGCGRIIAVDIDDRPAGRWPAGSAPTRQWRSDAVDVRRRRARLDRRPRRGRGVRGGRHRARRSRRPSRVCARAASLCWWATCRRRSSCRCRPS